MKIAMSSVFHMANKAGRIRITRLPVSVLVFLPVITIAPCLMNDSTNSAVIFFNIFSSRTGDSMYSVNR